MDILVSGSMAYDRIMDFPGRFSDHILPDQIHMINVSFTVNSLTENFGGTAGNIAYSLSLLGEKPRPFQIRIIATVGIDYHRYFDWLGQRGVGTGDIRIVPGELTAGAYITTDSDNNQITGFNPGAMKHQAGFDFAGVDPANAIAIVGPGNIQDMADFAVRHQEMGIYSIFDPGQSLPIWEPENLARAIRQSNVLIANDYELEMILNRTGLSRGGRGKRGGACDRHQRRGWSGADRQGRHDPRPGDTRREPGGSHWGRRRLPRRANQGDPQRGEHGAGGADGRRLRPLRRANPGHPDLRLYARRVQRQAAAVVRRVSGPFVRRISFLTAPASNEARQAAEISTASRIMPVAMNLSTRKNSALSAAKQSSVEEAGVASPGQVVGEAGGAGRRREPSPGPGASGGRTGGRGRARRSGWVRRRAEAPQRRFREKAHAGFPLYGGK